MNITAILKVYQLYPVMAEAQPTKTNVGSYCIIWSCPRSPIIFNKTGIQRPIQAPNRIPGKKRPAEMLMPVPVEQGMK